MENENTQEQELEQNLEENEENPTESPEDNQEGSDQEELDKLKAEVAKYKAIAERKEKKLNKPNQEPKSDGDERIDRLELKIEGYSDDEINFIVKNGGKEAKEDEFVQSAIQSMRDKKKSDEATPESTSKSPVLKKYTEEDIKNMPLDQLEKIIPQE